MTLFGRRCVVVLDADGRALRVEGLTVRFNIELDVKNFGKAKIEVINLNAEHRKRFEESKDVDVELLVGYVDNALERLCKGTLRDVYSQYDPPEWVTVLRTGDGDKASKVRANRSYSPGTPLSSVWKDLVDSLKGQVDAGNAIAAFSKGQYANGIKELLHGGAVHGSALDNIKRLASGAGLDVTIQEGELVVTEIGQPLATSAIVLSADTGLIGSPQPGPKKKLKCRSLILPGLKPKRQIEIRSKLTTGVYTILKAKYTGDTSSNDWYADLECQEV